jgi:hypothetical protein
VRKSLLDLKLPWVAVISSRLNWKTLYDLARALCKDEEKVERPTSDMQQHAVIFQESKQIVAWHVVSSDRHPAPKRTNSVIRRAP